MSTNSELRYSFNTMKDSMDKALLVLRGNDYTYAKGYIDALKFSLSLLDICDKVVKINK